MKRQMVVAVDESRQQGSPRDRDDLGARWERDQPLWSHRLDPPASFTSTVAEATGGLPVPSISPPPKRLHMRPPGARVELVSRGPERLDSIRGVGHLLPRPSLTNRASVGEGIYKPEAPGHVPGGL